MKDINVILQQTKEASSVVAKLSADKKEKLLLAIAEELEKNKETIFSANKKDVEFAETNEATKAFIQRLTVTQNVLDGIISQLKIVAGLEDPINEIIEERTLTNGIQLKKRRFPLGVILMIYESRPNVTVDVAGLCLKSGNAVILKGGKESLETNRVLIECIHKMLEQFDLPKDAVTFLDEISHEEVAELLTRSDMIDVVIPRGSYALTTAVAEKARIPILYHASGGARMYIDKSANLEQAIELCVNAKTNKTGVCNALDMLLVNEEIAEKVLPKIAKRLIEKEFEIRVDQQSKEILKPFDLAQDGQVQNDEFIKQATDEDFATEFLDSILAVKIVKDADEALEFIKQHTHHHTEVLVAEDESLIEKFINEIDAAGLMINCSSRLHDGGEFGMGAEMGTATGKLHARGPVGIRELTTYKWIAYGKGQLKK